MTVEKLAEVLGLSVANASHESKEVTGGYCGDLLSWVMGRAPAGCAWMTVMGNLNAVAVSVLAGVSCIILAEGAQPDREALEKAREKGVDILLSGKSAFDLAVALHEALGK